MTIQDMIYQIGNGNYEELDQAIKHLTETRKVRAAYRARCKFRPGDKVEFPWVSSYGNSGTHSGIVEGPDSEDPGKLRITNVTAPDGGSVHNTHVVDSFKVTLDLDVDL